MLFGEYFVLLEEMEQLSGFETIILELLSFGRARKINSTQEHFHENYFYCILAAIL